MSTGRGSKARIGQATFLAISALVGSHALGAASTYIFSGAVSGDVSNASNWTAVGTPTDTAPPNGANSDVAVFDGTAPTVAGVIALTNSGSSTNTTTGPGITVDITSPAALTLDPASTTFRLGASAFTLGAGAGAFTYGHTSGTLIGTTLGVYNVLTATFANNSSNTATIASNVLFTGGGNGSHIISVGGTSDWVFNDVIYNGSSGGSDITSSGNSLAITKTGTDTVTLNGADQYSGSTNVLSGTIKATVNKSLGFGGQLALNQAYGAATVGGSSATGAATLDLGGATTVNKPFNLDGSTKGFGASLINSNTAGTVTIDNGIAAVVFSVAGSGYSTTYPALTFSGGGGSGGVGSANIQGGVVHTTYLGAAGTGYTSTPGVTVGGGGSGAMATAVLSSITLTGTNNNIGGNGNLTINAAIGQSAAGAAGFTKIGNGITTLNGAETYTGATAISAGQLTLTGSVAGAVNVNGGSFAGTGTAAGAVTVAMGAAISPGVGNAVNALTMNGLTLNGSGSFTLSTTTGLNDELVSSGAVVLNSATATISLTDQGDGSGVSVGSVFTLINNTSGSAISGTFANLADGGSISVGAITYTANYEGGVSGDNLVLDVTSVPEPAAVGVFGFVAAGVVCRRRRRVIARSA